MTAVQHQVVTDPGAVAVELHAVHRATPDGVLHLTASSPGRCLGAVASVDEESFTLRTASLRPARPEIGLTSGPVAELGAEVSSVLDAASAADPAGPPVPHPGATPRPLLPEDALLLADLVRDGDPERLREGLDLTGCPRPPRWLRDLAFGARLRITACLVDRSGARVFADAVMTDQGWGCLDLHAGLIRFTPLTADDVRRMLQQACTALAHAGAPSQVA